MINLGTKIKQARLNKELTQKELATMLGVTHNVISNWEKEINRPDVDNLELLCQILNIDPNEIFSIKSVNNEILTKDVKVLIDLYNKLDNHGKEIVDGVLNCEIKRIKEEQKKAQELKKIAHIEQPKYTIQKFSIPASAGNGQPLDHVDNESIELDSPPPRGAGYALEVRGDSMEPLYHDGQLVFIDPLRVVNQGQIGVFRHNGEAYVKVLGNGELISKNAKYKPIMADESTTCLGRVIGVYHPHNEPSYEYYRIARSKTGQKPAKPLTKETLDNLRKMTLNGELDNDYDV